MISDRPRQEPKSPDGKAITATAAGGRARHEQHPRTNKQKNIPYREWIAANACRQPVGLFVKCKTNQGLSLATMFSS